MPKRRFLDEEKNRKYRNRQRKINYSSTQGYPPRHFSKQEDILVLEHKIPDRQLSFIIGKSVQSIQIRRSRLKKGLKNNEQIGTNN